MTEVTLSPPTVPKKRGPQTPEGKARSAMNALKHGLRARSFGILPEESPAEWTEHVSDLRAGYGPVDAAEEKLVTAIAVAMWKEIRADRAEAEVMAEIPPCRPDRSHGTDLQEPRHAMSLGTAIRYMTAAGMATQRAQRAFLAHRKAKRAGLIVAEPAEAAVPAANQNCTNEFGADRPLAPAPPQQPASDSQKCTNEFPPPRLPKPDPLAALRARLERLLDGPGPREPEEWDLIAAIRAVKLPGAPRPTAAGSTGSSWRRPWTASASMSPASPGSPRSRRHRPGGSCSWRRRVLGWLQPIQPEDPRCLSRAPTRESTRSARGTGSWWRSEYPCGACAGALAHEPQGCAAWRRSVTDVLPRAEHALVDLAKLRDYCLSPTHPRGRHKARVFRAALGLEQSDAAWLRDALLAAARTAPGALDASDRHGERWRVDLTLTRGQRTAIVRTWWLVGPPRARPRLVTCFVA